MLGVFNIVRRRYARKFALMALVIIVVTAGIGAVTQQDISSTVNTSQQTNVQTSAQLEANALGQWLEGSKQQVRTLSNHRGLQDPDQAAVESTLQAELEQMPAEAMELHYVDRTSGDRTVLASTNEDVTGESLNQTNIFWNPAVGFQFDGDDSVTESFVYKTGNKSAVALASPVPDTEYAVVAVLRTDVRAESFSSSIEGTRTVTIGGVTGLVLFAEDDAALLESYHGDENTTVERVATGENRSLNGSIVTEDHVVGYASVPGTDWVVVKEAPKSAALAVLRDVENSLVVLLGSALVGLVLLGAITTLGPMRSLRKLSAQAQSIAAGDLSEDIPDTNRIDEVGQVQTAFRETKAYLDTVADQSDALAAQDFDAPVLDESVPGRLGESHETMRRDLQEAFAEVQRARQEAEQRRNHLQEKAQAYSEAMRQTADGDLTQRLDPESESEAMTDIATEFNEMIEQIETIIDQLTAFANEVAAASEEVTASSEEVQSASQRVSRSIQQISDGADRQNESLRSVQTEMESLSTTTEQIAASSNEVADIAERTAKTGQEGREAAQDAIEGMSEIEQGSEEAVTAIEALESEVAQIDELIDFIDDVAKQTDMLALNANIEVSRGEGEGETDDDGFGAVAEEIKELAEETRDAAGDIEERLDRIQARTDETAKEVQTTANRVSEHTQSVQEAVNALDEIAEFAQETNTGVQEISAATEEQAASTQEIVAMVDEAANISEQTSTASEDVAGAAEQQTAALRGVSDSASSLSSQASQLSEALDQFDTRAATGSETDSTTIDPEPPDDTPE